MPQVERQRITGQQAAHEYGQRNLCRPEEEMHMVVQQTPGKAWSGGFYQQGLQPLAKIVTVIIVQKDIRAFNPANDDMLQKSGKIDSGMSWHERRIA